MPWPSATTCPAARPPARPRRTAGCRREAWQAGPWYAPAAPRPAARRRWPYLLAGFLAGVVTVPAAFLAAGAVTDRARTGSVDAQVQAELPGLEAYVERTRGLTFLHPVRVEVLGEDDFFDALDDSGSGPDLVDATGTDATAQALGEGSDLSGRERGRVLAGRGRLLRRLRRAARRARARQLDAYARQTIVHELTHALQDQHFDLSVREDAASTPEEQLAWRALVEGDATRVDQAWYDAQPGDVQDQIDDVSGPLEPVPDPAQDGFGFPYYAGPTLVRGLLNAGGQAALDAAFAAPPVDTAQVLHPGAAAPVDVPLPTGLPSGDVLDTGVLGELGLAHLLGRDATRGGPQAGWAGDRYTTVQEPLGPCTYDDVVTRTPAEQRSLLVALQGWVEGRDDASVTPTGPTGLRLRSCWDS